VEPRAWEFIIVAARSRGEQRIRAWAKLQTMVADDRVVVPLPKDAALVELRPESLGFETYQCLLPGTYVVFNLVLEGHQLPLRVPIARTEVVGKDWHGVRYASYILLDTMTSTDRHIIDLFIKKGRGEPELKP
jgi:hypothetical protein